MKLDHDHDEVPRNRMLLCIFHWIPYVCWFIMVHSPRTAAWIPIPWSSSMWFPLKLWHILPEMMRWSLWSSFFGRHTCHKSGKTMSIARHPPWSIPGGGSRGLRKKLLTMDQLLQEMHASMLPQSAAKARARKVSAWMMIFDLGGWWLWTRKHMGMDQHLLIPFLGEWTSIYQLFWCSPGVQGFDTLPHRKIMITQSLKFV